MSRRLFLRWLWLVVAATAALAALAASGFASGLKGAPLVATVAILLIAASVSGYCGRLFWQADKTSEIMVVGARARERRRIVHDAEHVFYAVAVLQILGLIGAMLGYREESRAAGLADSSSAIRELSLGLGNGLTATLCGVACSLVVWLQYHALTHRLQG